MTISKMLIYFIDERITIIASRYHKNCKKIYLEEDNIYNKYELKKVRG